MKMKVRLSREAFADLDRILSSIEHVDEMAAIDDGCQIDNILFSLEYDPGWGGETKRQGLRKLSFPAQSRRTARYLMVYEVTADTVIVHSVSYRLSYNEMESSDL